MGRKRKAGTINAYVSIDTTIEENVDIEISQLDDDELLLCVAEAQTRGLFAGGKNRSGEQFKAAMIEAIDELYRHRHQRAIDVFEAAFFAEDSFSDAYRALRNGDWNAAIACIDRGLYPTPAATATKIPDELLPRPS